LSIAANSASSLDFQQARKTVVKDEIEDALASFEKDIAVEEQVCSPMIL
jgi:hypothetical protein